MYGKCFSYLVGALRDGSVYRYERNRSYYVIWYSSDRQYLENEVCSRIRKIGYNCGKVYMYKKSQYRVRISSKSLFETITKKYGHPGKTNGSITWYTPEPIKKAEFFEQIEYVKGFVDAEGSVIASNKGIQIDVSQKIIEPLEFLKKIMEQTGIETTGIYKGKDNVWRLRISSKKSIIKFQETIGFRLKKKKHKLFMLLNQQR